VIDSRSVYGSSSGSGTGRARLFGVPSSSCLSFPAYICKAAGQGSDEKVLLLGLSSPGFAPVCLAVSIHQAVAMISATAWRKAHYPATVSMPHCNYMILLNLRINQGKPSAFL
jgi:hypothetical protein